MEILIIDRNRIPADVHSCKCISISQGAPQINEAAAAGLNGYRISDIIIRHVPMEMVADSKVS